MASGISGLALALALAACGGAGDTAAGLAMGKTASPEQGFLAGMTSRQETMPTFHNDPEFRFDPECPGQVSTDYLGIIDNSISRFNSAYPPDSSTGKVSSLVYGQSWDNSSTAPPGHGPVVMICGSRDIFAFSHGREVSVSQGLLAMLEQSTDRVEYPSAGMTGPTEQGGLLESALAFIIYHELGHIYLGHTIPAGGQLQGAGQCCAEEIQADLFAASALRKAGYPMDGASLVFEFLERTNPDGTPAHPGARLRHSLISAAP